MASRGVRVTAIPGGKGDYRGTVSMCTAGHQEQFSLAVLHAREVLQCAAVSVGHCRAPRKFCGCPNRPGAFLVGGSQVWGPDPSVPPIWRCFANLTKCSLNICHGCGQAARTVGTMGLARWRAPWRHHRRGLCTACLAWQPVGHCKWFAPVISRRPPCNPASENLPTKIDCEEVIRCCFDWRTSPIDTPAALPTSSMLENTAF